VSPWPKVAIGLLGKVITGSTPQTSDAGLYGGDVPFVTPAELGSPEPIMTAARTLSHDGSSVSRLLPKDAVLVCCIGSLGKVGIAGTTLATNQQINAVVFDQGRVWPRFGYHACVTLKPKLESMAPATTVAIVNKSRFSSLEISLPPLPEQRRIAAILDQADALRAKRRAAIAQLDTLAQSVFIDMFGDPTTNSHGWPETVMGTLFAAPPIFGTMTTPSADRGTWLSLRVANIQEWTLDLRDRKYVDLNSGSIERHSVQDGDMLMARAIATRQHLEHRSSNGRG